MRRWLVIVLTAAATIGAAASAGAQGDDVGAPTPPVATDASSAVSQTTVPPASTLPAGCAAPDPPHAVFVGEAVRIQPPEATINPEFSVVRFKVVAVVDGSIDGFAGAVTPTGPDDEDLYTAGALFVDVAYGRDYRHVDQGGRYRVAADIDVTTGMMRSKARIRPEMFGGDQVVGVDDDPNCPTFEDPIITTHDDGTSLETGILSPMLVERRSIARAFIRPAVAALVVLAGLVVVKHLIAWLARVVMRAAQGRARARRRRSSSGPGPTPNVAEARSSPPATPEPSIR